MTQDRSHERRADPAAGIQAAVEACLGERDSEVEVLAVDVIGAHRTPLVRIFIDRPGGVDLGVCTRVTHDLRDLLSDYTVEVSSPGPARPLTKPDHYRRFVGRRVRVRTREAIEGRRDFKGELVGADDRGVALAAEWGTIEIPLERIRRSNLVPQPAADGNGR